jgi:hypothetical protein
MAGVAPTPAQTAVGEAEASKAKVGQAGRRRVQADILLAAYCARHDPDDERPAVVDGVADCARAELLRRIGLEDILETVVGGQPAAPRGTAVKLHF